MPSFDSFPLWGNLIVLLVAAVIVWISGVKLEGAVQAISTRTRIGSAFGGLVLLALSTSLPELSTTVTGARLGDAAMVTNNLLGGVMLQTTLLVMADWSLGRGALTYFAPKFTLLVSGTSLLLLLGAALAVMAVGEKVSYGSIGVGTTVLFTVHVAQLYLAYRGREHSRWDPVTDKNAPLGREKNPDKASSESASLSKSWWIFAGFSAAIFVAGSVVMNAASALTKQTGLSSSFVGATLVALATSLPEVSTTLTAVRRGHHALAISNIFGSNLWCVALLFVGDIFYRPGPILADAPRQAIFTCAMGIVLTSVYLWGLLERRNRTFGRLGVDSIVVLSAYILGMVLLYRMG